MPGFVETFGGSTIYPSQTTYLSLTMTADVDLSWPIEQQVGGDIVADIIDVSASVAGLEIVIPDARQVTTGYTALFNNVGAETVTIVSATGATLVSLSSGTCWQIYLRDNSTESGLWRTFQYGASTSVADAAALAGAGLKAVSNTLNARMASQTRAVNYTVLDSDRATAQIWTAGAGTFNLPDPATVGADWYVWAKNLGSGDLTITPAAGTIDDAASLTLSPGEAAMCVSDGADYFTLGTGGGGGGSSGFDFIDIDVSGAGNYTLSGNELNRISYEFTGVLSGNRSIIVPATIQQYWVNNETSGAFSLTIKTATQVGGVVINQGDQNIVYCDGTDVIPAVSATVSFPIPVNQGGTNATTAAAARTNLGASSVGDAVFVAASAAAARTAIGATSLGADIFTAANAAAVQALIAVPPNTRTLTAGSGLVGGGDLSTDRSFAVGQGTGIIVNADDVAVDRSGTDGNQVGYLDATANSQSGNYTTVMSDRGKLIIHPSGGGAGDTYTIAANASVAYPLGTVISFANADSNSVTIAIASDSMFLAGTALTGSRTLGSAGFATAIKVATTTWVISGPGLT